MTSISSLTEMRRHGAVCVILFAALFAAAPLSADALFQVLPYIDGRPVGDAEVCFFRGRSGDSFFDRFLTAEGVRCYPSDRVIALPAGLWNYFVQRSDGWVSTHPFAVDVSCGGAGRRQTDACGPA